MSNTLDFIQTYVATNTENHNLRNTEFKLKSCSETLILTIKNKGNIYCVFIGIPVIYYFLYNSEILVNE